MNACESKKNSNPREETCFLGELFWTWTFRLFKKSYRANLNSEDLFLPLENHRANVLSDKLEKIWREELEKKKTLNGTPNFLFILCKCFFWEIFLCGVLHVFIEFVLSLGIPILLEKLLHQFRDPEELILHEALIYACGICLISLLKGYMVNHYMFNAFQIGTKIRVAVCSVLYRKLLKLNSSPINGKASRTIINLLTDHVSRFEYVVYLSHYMWSAPMLLIITSIILYTQIGYFGLLGITVMFMFSLIQLSLGLLSLKYRKDADNETNVRIQRIQEIIYGIKMIKINAWEKYFCTVISITRKLELQAIKKSGLLSIISIIFIFLFASKAAMYFTIFGMLYFDVQLISGRIFVLFCFLNILSYSMNLMFVNGINEFCEFQVSVKNIQTFLMCDEVTDLKFRTIVDSLNDQNSETIPNIPYIDDDTYSNASDATNPSAMEVFNRVNSLTSKNWAIKITNANAKWDVNDSESILDNVNLMLERGKLYALIGTKYSGKSSLLLSILGELPLISGNINIRGNISYASQEPWIFNSTVRQNIIFGKPYDGRRYQKVVKLCALQRDFQKFPEGDQTIVGENGNLLSEEQKAKVNLARVVYQQANIYIFDDVLSDINVFIGNYIFEECIQKYLFGHTRILATRQLQYVKNVDGIILIENKSAKVFSNYNDFLNNCPEYLTLLADEARECKINTIRKESNQKSFRSLKNNTILEESEETNSEDNKAKNKVKVTFCNMIRKSIPIQYLKFGTNWTSLIFISFLFIITQIVASFSDIFFMAIVDNTDFSRPRLNYNQIIHTEHFYIYTGSIFSIFIFLAIKSGLFYTTCMRSNQKLHDKLINSFIKTKLEFFNTNSIRRIMNCISKDVATIDRTFPKNALDFGQIWLIVIGSIMIICGVNYIFLLPATIIFGICYTVRTVFIRIGRNAKRLEEIIISQIYNRIYVTLDGLDIIRVCGADTVLRTEFDQLQNDHSSAWSICFSSYTVFSFIVSTLCSLFITTVIFTCVLTNFGATSAGLAIVSVLSLPEICQWKIFQGIEIRNQLGAIRRILELSRLSPEDSSEMKNTTKQQLEKKTESSFDVLRLPDNWPTQGTIQFHKFSAFSGDPNFPVLQNFNATIKSAEKIGIVEKLNVDDSSIISALFRLTTIDGVLKIDHISTEIICLDDWRKKISLIPKNPVLFSGTLRMNLDPYLEFSDFELWAALEETGLKRTFSESDGLDIKIVNIGINLTNNKKQLIYLARAILRNNKILIYHVSESITPHTDYLIQKIIRSKFANCTVFIISHRLDSIIESDKVLVIDNGRVVEFDHPYVLLKNKSTRFSSLVRNSGRVMSDKLIELAYEAYNNESGVWV